MRPLGCLYLIKLLLKLLSLNLAFVAIRDRSLFVISMVVHVTLDVFVVAGVFHDGFLQNQAYKQIVFQS